MRVVLTDFSEDKWADLDKSNIEEKIKELQNLKLLFGELDHISEDNQIRLINVSHRIDNIEYVDDKILADVIIIKTPSGEIINGMMEVGMIPKFEMRASMVIEKEQCENKHIDIDPYGEEIWDDDINSKKIKKINKIYSWDINF